MTIDRHSAIRSLISPLGEEGFLVGPGRDPSSVRIDASLERPLRQVLHDLAIALDVGAMTAEKRHAWIEGLMSEEALLDCDGHVAFVRALAPGGDACAGVLALAGHPLGIVGAYTGTTLVVAEGWQRQGIGRRLVAERLLAEGELPAWSEDPPSHSPGSAAAHRSAWRFLVARNDHELPPFDPSPQG